MPKLPHIKMRPPPAGQIERLGRWFDQWNFEQRIRHSEPESAEAFQIAPPEQRHSRPELESFKVAEFDSNPRVGEIRLLDSGLFKESRRPLYVAILSEWPPVDNGREEEPTIGISQRDISPRGFNPRFGSTSKPEAEKSYLVAPFGRFSEPGTTTEWLAGHEAGPLRVLCLWNTRDYPAKWLELSWKVGELTEQELADAWDVFRHALTGIPLPDRLREQVGAPIVHPHDPRLAYQAEETRLFTVVPEYAEHRSQQEQATQNKFIEFYSILKIEELALAAGTEDGGGETRDYIVLVKALNIQIWFHPSSAGDNVFAEVFAADGSPSKALNGAALLDQDGKMLAQFDGNKAKLPFPQSVSRLSLRDVSGKMLSWKILREK